MIKISSPHKINHIQFSANEKNSRQQSGISTRPLSFTNNDEKKRDLEREKSIKNSLIGTGIVAAGVGAYALIMRHLDKRDLQKGLSDLSKNYGKPAKDFTESLFKNKSLKYKIDLLETVKDFIDSDPIIDKIQKAPEYIISKEHKFDKENIQRLMTEGKLPPDFKNDYLLELREIGSIKEDSDGTLQQLKGNSDLPNISLKRSQTNQAVNNLIKKNKLDPINLEKQGVIDSIRSVKELKIFNRLKEHEDDILKKAEERHNYSSSASYWDDNDFIYYGFDDDFSLL